jgi:hypothetical protein
MVSWLNIWGLGFLTAIQPTARGDRTGSSIICRAIKDIAIEILIPRPKAQRVF